MDPNFAAQTNGADNRGWHFDFPDPVIREDFPCYGKYYCGAVQILRQQKVGEKESEKIVNIDGGGEGCSKRRR